MRVRPTMVFSLSGVKGMGRLVEGGAWVEEEVSFLSRAGVSVGETLGEEGLTLASSSFFLARETDWRLVDSLTFEDREAFRLGEAAGRLGEEDGGERSRTVVEVVSGVDDEVEVGGESSFF